MDIGRIKTQLLSLTKELTLYNCAHIFTLYYSRVFLPWAAYTSASDLTDVDIDFSDLDPSLFPGVFDGVQVHSGFADEHAKTANQVLAEVKKLMSEHNTTKVTPVSTRIPVHANHD